MRRNVDAAPRKSRRVPRRRRRRERSRMRASIVGEPTLPSPSARSRLTSSPRQTRAVRRPPGPVDDGRFGRSGTWIQSTSTYSYSSQTTYATVPSDLPCLPPTPPPRPPSRPPSRPPCRGLYNVRRYNTYDVMM